MSGSKNRKLRRHRAYVAIAMDAIGELSEEIGTIEEMMFWTAMRDLIESRYPNIDNDVDGITAKQMKNDIFGELAI